MSFINSNRGIYNLLITFFLFILILIFICAICRADSIVVESGRSIQDAIDRASSGDTIEIKEGTYKESINVHKSVKLYGQNVANGRVVIQGDHNNKSTITLSADRCTIQGLTIISSESCALSVLSKFNNITSNNIAGKTYGIYLNKASSNIIDSNNISVEGSFGRSMIILYSSDNIIENNNISYYGGLTNGIDIFLSNQNNISHNYIKGNGLIGGSGISIHNSDYNILHDNSIKSKGLWGSSIYLMASNNNSLYYNDVIHQDFSGSGITLSDSNKNDLTKNMAKSKGQLNCDGIFLRHSDGNRLISNNGSSTGTYGSGICLIYSADNQLIDNRALCNAYGLYLYTSNNNKIENNNAENNNEYGIELDYYCANNHMENNTATAFIIEPHRNHISDNHGEVKGYEINFADELPILTLSDLVDFSLLIKEAAFYLFSSN